MCEHRANGCKGIVSETGCKGGPTSSPNSPRSVLLDQADLPGTAGTEALLDSHIHPHVRTSREHRSPLTESELMWGETWSVLR